MAEQGFGDSEWLAVGPMAIIHQSVGSVVVCSLVNLCARPCNVSCIQVIQLLPLALSLAFLLQLPVGVSEENIDHP